MQHFAIPVTLCDHPPKKSHWVATPIDHPVCVAYCLPLPYCSPFYFCALLLPSYSISISFHILFPILSIFHILPLSLFCDLLLFAMHSVLYCQRPSNGPPKDISPYRNKRPTSASNVWWSANGQVCGEDICSMNNCHLYNFSLSSWFDGGPAKRRNNTEVGHMPYNMQTNKCHGTLYIWEQALYC